MRIKSSSVARIAATAALLALSSSGWTGAPTTVNVLLQDSSSDPTLQSMMRIHLDRDTVPTGTVTFRAVNQSKAAVHEVIVVRPKTGHVALPYDDKKSEVDERRIQRLGEISDLKPGASGALTLTLKPGSYLLICNQPGHYKAGMSTTLSVTK